MSSSPVVLVTGAARRLGRAIALELGRHGWQVAVHHRTSAIDARSLVAELEGLGARAAAVQADLLIETECRALVPAVVERLGRIDAVVNNASLFEYDAIDSFGYAAMERHWRANTAAPVVLARGLHAALVPGATGCVVNLLDQKLWNPNPDYLSYTLSKAALQAATVVLAQALAPRLRVCGVAPGVTLPSAGMAATTFEAVHRMTPLEHSSSPADIAAAVRFLLEAPAVTGTTLLVDGGQHLGSHGRDVAFLAKEAR